MKAKLTSKGQLTIPVRIREQMDLQPGDRVSFEPSGANSFVMRKSGGTYREVVGALSHLAMNNAPDKKDIEKARKAEYASRAKNSEGSSCSE